MAIAQFRLFRICTCLATVLSFFKRLICRSGRLRKLSGDQITLPTTVDFSTVPKQVSDSPNVCEECTAAATVVPFVNPKVVPQQNDTEAEEPDYFKDMAPTIRKTQKIVLKKRDPMNFAVSDSNAGFSSRLAVTQDMSFNQPSAELGDLHTWQEDSNAWEDEADAAWDAEEVLRYLLFSGVCVKMCRYLGRTVRLKRLKHSVSRWHYNFHNRQQKMAEREKRALEQQRKKLEKEAQRLSKKEQKIAVKLS
uniref:Estrogen receptor binding site associated antigen 9 n=1 Tax=Lepisosteus oculatus TaxID=7918 RepID=W5M524_LEPOC